MTYANMDGVPTQTAGTSELLASDWNTYVRDNFDDIKFGHVVCTSSTRPTGIAEGTMIYETDTNKVLVYNGSAWVEVHDLDTSGTFPDGALNVSAGSFGRAAPVTKTGDFTVGTTENWLICNKTSTITVTLPTASSFSGREIMIKNISTGSVVSNASNVVPIGSATAGTAILPAQAGTYATLVSDGTNWIITDTNQDNGLVYITKATASAASSTIVTDCFSASFRDYMIIFNLTDTGGNIDINLFLRTSAGSTSTTDYSTEIFTADNTQLSGSRIENGTAGFRLSPARTENGNNSFGIAYLGSPFLAEYTQHRGWGSMSYASTYLQDYTGQHEVSTSYSSIEIKTSSSTWTGTATIYGIRA